MYFDFDQSVCAYILSACQIIFRESEASVDEAIELEVGTKVGVGLDCCGGVKVWVSISTLLALMF